MKRYIKLLGISLVTLGLLAACSGDGDVSTSKTVNNDTLEQEKSQNVKNSSRDNDHLNLGETAFIDSNLGKFEATIDAIEFHEEGEYKYIIADMNIKNLSEEILDVGFLFDGLILGNMDNSFVYASWEPDFIDNHLQGVVSLNSSVTGKVAFPVSDFDQPVNIVYGFTVNNYYASWNIK